MEKKVRIAMGQMLVEPGEVDANLSRACKMIHDAANQGCYIIVLPETLDVGWTYPGAKELSEPIPGYSSDKLCQAAKQAGIYVVAGLTERYFDHVYNAAIVISNTGEILITHRKINELSFALDVYTIGDKLNTIDTEYGKIGLAICADLRPEGDPIGNTLGLMGSRLLLSPCAWAVKPDHDNELEPYGKEWIDPYSKIAKKHQMTVVGVSNVGMVLGGEWDGWRCIGSSIAVGADGKVLAQGPYGEKAEELMIIEV